MKLAYTTLALALMASPAFAQKSCDELKAEISAKIEAKGVKNFQLDIIDNAEIKQQKIVGSCGGGSKKITYTRN